MSEDNERVSSDLIRWLKLLALPTWAKVGLALIMLLALSNALALLVGGMLHKDKESISAAVSILTVGLPIGLIVVALVFGDGGARKLRQLTLRVLDREVPQAIRENLTRGQFADAQLAFTTRGYMTDYELSAKKDGKPTRTMRFRLELNVRKVNVVFFVPFVEPLTTSRAIFESSTHLHGCLLGAEREGYELNMVPVVSEDEDKVGVVFIKTLHEDFLLEPAHRIYFAQDFAFFARGMLEANLNHG